MRDSHLSRFLHEGLKRVDAFPSCGQGRHALVGDHAGSLAAKVNQVAEIRIKKSSCLVDVCDAAMDLLLSTKILNEEK